MDEVEVAGHAVRVKVSAGRVKVEHDDASRAARRAGLPVREVISLAEEAWRRRDERLLPPGDSAPRETDASLDYGGVVERGPWPHSGETDAEPATSDSPDGLDADTDDDAPA